jgi:hypothetical protein
MHRRRGHMQNKSEEVSIEYVTGEEPEGVPMMQDCQSYRKKRNPFVQEDNDAFSSSRDYEMENMEVDKTYETYKHAQQQHVQHTGISKNKEEEEQVPSIHGILSSKKMIILVVILVILVIVSIVTFVLLSLGFGYCDKVAPTFIWILTLFMIQYPACGTFGDYSSDLFMYTMFMLSLLVFWLFALFMVLLVLTCMVWFVLYLVDRYLLNCAPSRIKEAFLRYKGYIYVENGE